MKGRSKDREHGSLHIFLSMSSEFWRYAKVYNVGVIIIIDSYR